MNRGSNLSIHEKKRLRSVSEFAFATTTTSRLALWCSRPTRRNGWGDRPTGSNASPRPGFPAAFPTCRLASPRNSPRRMRNPAHQASGSAGECVSMPATNSSVLVRRVLGERRMFVRSARLNIVVPEYSMRRDQATNVVNLGALSEISTCCSPARMAHGVLSQRR
jgi:hypothetical protein